MTFWLAVLAVGVVFALIMWMGYAIEARHVAFNPTDYDL